MQISAPRPAVVFGSQKKRREPEPGAFTVLVAEDNDTNIKVVQYMLAPFDCNIAIARDGRAAVRRFQTEKIDLVLMDIMMPELDGFDATREIRKIERTENLPPTPIVALTAHVLPADQHLCINAGMNDYLSKPLKPAELSNVLRVWAPSLRSKPKSAAPSP